MFHLEKRKISIKWTIIIVLKDRSFDRNLFFLNETFPEHERIILFYFSFHYVLLQENERKEKNARAQGNHQLTVHNFNLRPTILFLIDCNQLKKKENVCQWRLSCYTVVDGEPAAVS